VTAIATERSEDHVLDWVDDEAPFDAGRLTAVALDALDAFALALAEPLALEVALACADAVTGDGVGLRPTPPGWLAVRRELPAGVSPSATYRGAAPVEVDALDRSTVVALLARPVACEAGAPLWDELVIDAVRAPLPDAVAAALAPGQRELELAGAVGRRAAPLDWRGDRPCAVGPTAEGERPMTLSIRRDGGALTLRLTAGWSPWQTGGDGVAAVAGFLAALRRAGWHMG
jgi:hypothetical protein